MPEQLSKTDQIWQSITFPRIMALLSLIMFGLLVLFGKIDLIKFGAWIKQTGEANMARGLITFLVVFATVSIALTLVISLFYGDEEHRKDRFQLGQQVLTVFIGILGTIMGFYYAEGSVSVEKIDKLKKETPQISVSAADLEKSGFEALIASNFANASDSFSKASKIPEHSSIVDKINVLLTSKEDRFAQASEVEKKTIWKEIFCKIGTYNVTLAEIKEKLDKQINESECLKPTPTPTLTPSLS